MAPNSELSHHTPQQSRERERGEGGQRWRRCAVGRGGPEQEPKEGSQGFWTFQIQEGRWEQQGKLGVVAQAAIRILRLDSVTNCLNTFSLPSTRFMRPPNRCFQLTASHNGFWSYVGSVISALSLDSVQSMTMVNANVAARSQANWGPH